MSKQSPVISTMMLSSTNSRPKVVYRTKMMSESNSRQSVICGACQDSEKYYQCLDKDCQQLLCKECGDKHNPEHNLLVV